MAQPELLCALGGFLLGVSVTRIAARFRTIRLHARLEAAEFETAHLREQLERDQRADATGPAAPRST
jgi:hypothetical protein